MTYFFLMFTRYVLAHPRNTGEVAYGSLDVSLKIGVEEVKAHSGAFLLAFLQRSHQDYSHFKVDKICDEHLKLKKVVNDHHQVMRPSPILPDQEHQLFNNNSSSHNAVVSRGRQQETARAPRSRSGTVGMVMDLANYCMVLHPTSSLTYLGMCPRFTDKCCHDRTHMTDDDSWVLNNNRCEIDLELRSKLGGQCETMGWYEPMGIDREPDMQFSRMKNVVGEDNVHMSDKLKRDTLLQVGGGECHADKGWALPQEKTIHMS